MLTLIEGGFFDGGHELIKEKIALTLANGKRAYLIVPEQQTVRAERELADFLSPQSALLFEATNFTRFANTVFRSLGGLTLECVNKTKKALFMWRALTELMPTMKSFGTARDVSSGAVSKMLGAVEQMRSLSLSPSELTDAHEILSQSPLTDERLLAKLGDISLVMALYRKLVSEHFSDSDDVLFEAEKRLLENDAEILKDTVIYIDGFTSFTEPQNRLISCLIKYCDVYVNLTLPKAAKDAFEYREIKSTHEKLMSTANKLNQDVHPVYTNDYGRMPSIIPELCNNIFRSYGAIDTDALAEANRIRVIEASDPFDECDFIADDIKKRVMGGAKYSDFAVIARDIGAYEGILDVSFLKAGVPLFISTRTDLGSYEAIKLIFAAFAAIGGYSRRDVISYAKCSLTGVKRALVDELEIYAETWQINGKRFTDGIAWNMNPAGYTSKRSDATEAKLKRIDEARRAVVEPLMAFENSLDGAVTVRDFAEALVKFLVSLGVEASLEEKSKLATKLTSNDGGEGLSRLWRLISDTLDSMVEAIGDIRINRDVFVTVLKIAFAESDMGRIPAYAEQVQAGSADIARMHGKKHIYIIGANAGEFPLATDDDSYFNAAEKRALKSAGLKIEEDTELRSARELFYFVRAMSYASESLTVIYSAEDIAFSSLRPSDAVTRILSLCNGAVALEKTSSLSAEQRIYSPEYAIEHLDKYEENEALRNALGDVGYSEKLELCKRPIKNCSQRLGKEAIDTLYGDTIKTSQSNLEKYVGCPMKYFCEVNLELDAAEVIEFDHKNIGIFIHSILECFFAKLKALGTKINDISDDEKIALIKEVAEKYLKSALPDESAAPARLKAMLDNLSRTAKPIIDSLADEFADCDFEPIFFELNINSDIKGSPESPVFVTDGGKNIVFTGKIDRVDTFEDNGKIYVRVIDYKTGSKKFSRSDISEGRNLQMLLYLKSITDSKNEQFCKRIGKTPEKTLVPAGVIYVKTSVQNAKISKNSPSDAYEAVKKAQGREGLILSDQKSIDAMNSKFIPVSFKKGTTTPTKDSADKLYTLDGWKSICAEMSRVISSNYSDMMRGDISAKPLIKSGGKSSVCNWCKFKPVCRNATVTKN